MANSFNYETYGLLNAWQRMNQERIWRFNQDAGQGAPLNQCQVYIQDDREQIVESLLEAKAMVERYLGYFHRPTWHVDQIPFGGGSPWQLQTLSMTHSKFIEWGQRAATLIQAGVAVTYSDPDGDGVNELATVTVNTTVDVNEIEIFFQVADGAPTAGDARYQIEPVMVTASGGVVTIKGHRALFTKPNTIWAVPFAPSDPNYLTRNYADTALTTGFVTAIDVYRVYNDSTIQAQILSDPLFDPTSTDPGVTVVNAVDARITNAALGIFQVRFPCWSDCHPPYPQYAKVYYRSGLPLVFGQPNMTILRAIIRLANAGMYRKLCSFCPETATIWAEDREEAVASQRHVGNPFGTLKGQVGAWLNVLAMAEAQGGAL